jgi:asparagine synthase (glutamine-hydrolysing)
VEELRLACGDGSLAYRMCGIAIMVGLRGAPIEAPVVRKMTRALVHRGPDAEGHYSSEWVGFGFRRLSILDLSPSGHQPMVSDDGETVVVFNGEIYNYLELRTELEQHGHRFRSTGDTEVLLNAYRQWGSECLRRLNGMWAFAILDRRRRVLFGSRDRFGEKPLYCYRRGDHVLLASEIKAILASGFYEGATHWPAVAKLLLQHALDTSPETFYGGIEQIEPGSGFELGQDGRWRTWRYWDLESGPRTDESAPATAFATLFSDSVRLRMRSDVPVGVCLSGGLDSTSIMCVMADVRGQAGNQPAPLEAFCYRSPDFDEGRYIEDTLLQTRAHVNSLYIDERRLWDILPAVLAFHDEPLHSPTALIGFELMRLAARRGVKVVLNGQGADETLGGYRSYFAVHWQSLAAAGRLGDCLREIRAYTAARGGNAPRMFLDAVVSARRAQVKRFLRLRDIVRRSSWLTEDFRRTFAEFSYRIDPPADFRSTLLRSVRVRPLPVYLRIEDRNSMAHSVEARLPFLDPRVVELAFSVDPSWKTRGPWNKFILREAMRGRIPESVRARVDKMGFPTSAKTWFRGPWYEPMQDLVRSHAFRERGIFDISALKRDLARHRSGDVDVSAHLFHAAQLELWLRMGRGDRNATPDVQTVSAAVG